MGSLQLSAQSALETSIEATPGSTVDANDDLITAFTPSSPSLPAGSDCQWQTPAAAEANAGWSLSMFDAPGDMSCLSYA